MMKRLFFAFALLAMTWGCSKGTTDIIGKWKLVEVLMDPGDGSGGFNPVSSDKTVTFLSDGTVRSNGAICWMSIAADSPSSAEYSLVDSTITSRDCPPDLPFPIRFEITGDELIISYPCIEPCRAKFRKI